MPIRRVRRPKNKEELFRALCQSEDKHRFLKYADLFMLAAAIGYSKQESSSFDESSEAMLWESFSENQHTMIRMLALSTTKDPSILLEENADKMLTIVENYANSGLDYIKRDVLDEEVKGKLRLNLLAELIMSNYNTNENITGEVILEKLRNS